jgi:hypothetical protein
VERAWTDAQDKLAKLTPARHVVAKRSSHYIVRSGRALRARADAG